MDGNLVGLHNFTLTPSMRERNRRLAGDYQADLGNDSTADEFDIIDELKQERAPKPPSLNDLLQEQRSSRLSVGTGSSSSSVNSDREPRRLTNTPRRRR